MFIQAAGRDDTAHKRVIELMRWGDYLCVSKIHTLPEIPTPDAVSVFVSVSACVVLFCLAVLGMDPGPHEC